MLTSIFALALAASPPSPVAPTTPAVSAASSDHVRSELDAAWSAATQRPTSTAVVPEPPQQRPALPVAVGSRTTDTSSLPWMAGLGILGLGVAGLLGLRRKRALGGALRVVESAPLGKGRAVVVVEVDGRRLVLGVTDHGIATLAEMPPHANSAGASTTTTSSPTPAGAGTMSMDGSLRSAFEEAFDASLSFADEDIELRKKLAAGRPL